MLNPTVDFYAQISNNKYMDQNTAEMQHATPIDVPEFMSSTPVSPTPKKRIGFDDVYLIFAICGFILSLGFMISNRNFTTSSDAKITRELILSPTPEQPSNAKYPKMYKEEKIPSTVYENTDSVSNVMKFYVYKDVLQEYNPIASSSLIPATYSDIKTGIEKMEPIITENLLSRAFFDYIQVKFAGMPDESELKQKYGDLDTKAKSIIKRYQQLFVGGNYSPNQIIDVSNKDEELLTLNDREQNKILDNYDASKNPFPDKDFNEFLFSQAENQISDIYTLKDQNSTPYAYIIVYPTKIMAKKYKSLDQIISERSSNFSY